MTNSKELDIKHMDSRRINLLNIQEQDDISNAINRKLIDNITKRIQLLGGLIEQLSMSSL